MSEDARRYVLPEDLETYLAGPEFPQGKYVVDYVGERFAGKPPFEHRRTLLIDDVLDWIDRLFMLWPIAGGIYDQWSSELISQLLAERGYGRRLTMVNLAAWQKIRSCGRGFARRSCPAS